MSFNMPPEDLVEYLRELERRIYDLETAAGLESASIGTGGLRVKDGGTIDIVDSGGNVTLSLSATQLLLAGLLSVTGTLDVDGTLTVAGDTNLDGPLSVSGDTTLDGALDVVAGGIVTVDGGDLVVLDGGGAEVFRANASGLTLEGLLQILAGGQFEFQDDNGDERVHIAGKADGEANLTYRSGPTGTDPEVAIGALFDETTGSLNGHGLLVQQADGTDLFEARSLNGVTRIELNYQDGMLALLLTDEIVANYPDGATAQRVSDDRWAVAYPDVGGAGTAVEVKDEMVLWAPGSRGIVVRITDADGLRVAVDTDADGIQSGQVTAGAADSAGTGFRTLRIPN